MKILLVDDDAAVRRAVSAYLVKQGHACLVAHSGEAALELMGEQEIDVALVDCWMPRHNGFETLRLMRQRRLTIPVILFSAMGTASTAREAIRRGAYAFMDKNDIGGKLDSLLEAAAAKAHQQNATIEMMGPERESSKGTILVVDDHEGFRSSVVRCLHRAGYRTREAGTSAAAVAAWQTGEVDTALIDIHLPDVDGIVTAQVIRALDPSAVVALMSGEADQLERTEGLNHTSIGCLDKVEGVDYIVQLADFIMSQAHKAREIKAAEIHWKSLSRPAKARHHARAAAKRVDKWRRSVDTKNCAVALVGAVLLSLVIFSGLTAIEQYIDPQSQNPRPGGPQTNARLGFTDMYSKIQGYLERDEQRELEQNAR